MGHQATGAEPVKDETPQGRVASLTGAAEGRLLHGALTTADAAPMFDLYVDGSGEPYLVPADPADAFGCDSCQ